MKKILCFVALLGTINLVSAQNTFPTGAGTNVGIGTSSPTSTLQVVGEARFGSNGPYTDLKIATQTPFSGYNQTNVVTPVTVPGSGLAKAALYLKSAVSVGTTRMDLLVDGNIGIGAPAPTSKLQIGVPGGATTVALSNDANIFGAYSATRGNLNIGTTDAAAADKGGMLTFSGESGQISTPYSFGGIRGAKETGGTYQGYLAFYTIPAGSVLTERMRINSAGNVGIGTADTKGYKLAVNGTVIATSVTVKLYADWPDYVFKKEYKLPALAEVKNYIDQNHHLPGMPSAAQVEKDGLNLGEMNTALTKKVEELTLYLIEKDQQLNKQQKEIDLLKEQFKLFLAAGKKRTIDN